MFVVYIIYSSSLNRYYVGSTDNLEKRFSEHNSGKGNYTSKGIPWILVHSVVCNSRIDAVNLEMRIKKRGIKRYLQDTGNLS
jgi:putative endonuclease